MSVTSDANTNCCRFMLYGRNMIKKTFNGILVNPPYKNYNIHLLSYDNVPMLPL